MDNCYFKLYFSPTILLFTNKLSLAKHTKDLFQKHLTKSYQLQSWDAEWTQVHIQSCDTPLEDSDSCPVLHSQVYRCDKVNQSHN